jgi:hypothetical protein
MKDLSFLVREEQSKIDEESQVKKQAVEYIVNFLNENFDEIKTFYDKEIKEKFINQLSYKEKNGERFNFKEFRERFFCGQLYQKVVSVIENLRLLSYYLEKFKFVREENYVLEEKLGLVERTSPEGVGVTLEFTSKGEEFLKGYPLKD